MSQKQQSVENWLDQAQATLDDCEDDYDSIIRKHKAFFVRIDERMLKDYIRAAKDILAVLEDDDRAALIESMENIQGRWEVRGQSINSSPEQGLFVIPFCIIIIQYPYICMNYSLWNKAKNVILFFGLHTMFLLSWGKVLCHLFVEF